MSTDDTTARPHRPQGPAVRRLQHHDPRDRAEADAPQPPHDLLHPGLPGRRCSSSFGGNQGWNDDAGHGNVAAYIMVSMALYGAALTAASAGAMVAMERAMGWSRQLRLTPLSPVVYISMKAMVALVMGARRGGRRQRRRHLPGQARHAGRRSGSPARCSPSSARWSSRRSASSSATWCPARTPCRSSAPAWRSCRSSATCSSRSTTTPA